MNNTLKILVSIARSAYWLGRTYCATNNINQANIWYHKAAMSIYTFYEQIAQRTKRENITSIRILYSFKR